LLAQCFAYLTQPTSVALSLPLQSNTSDTLISGNLVHLPEVKSSPPSSVVDDLTTGSTIAILSNHSLPSLNSRRRRNVYIYGRERRENRREDVYNSKLSTKDD